MTANKSWPDPDDYAQTGHAKAKDGRQSFVSLPEKRQLLKQSF